VIAEFAYYAIKRKIPANRKEAGIFSLDRVLTGHAACHPPQIWQKGSA